MEVCIIGGGFSGIISSKVALEHNMTPFVLNQSSSIGGLWNASPPSMKPWDSLHLNGSKHLASYSDQLWSTSGSFFPPASQFQQYLLSYVDSKKLSQYFHNSCKVINVQKQDSGYLVTWENAVKSIEKKVFEFVVVANGRFRQPVDDIVGKEEFKGEVVFAGEYKEPMIFVGKKVVVVGKSVSGSEIALDAVKTAKSVTQVWRRKMILLPKTIRDVPYDCFFNKIQNFEGLRPFVNFQDEVYQNQTKLIRFVGNPGDVLSKWKISDDELRSRQHGQHSCSNDYIDAVRSRKINCLQGEVLSLREKKVFLSGNKELEADIVVVCTGYTVDFDFLSADIQKKIEYDKKNKLLPFVAYRTVLHPALPGLGFVGFLFGAGGRYELQAEIIMKQFSGRLLVSEIELWQGVALEQWMRISLKGNYAAYDPFGYMRECLRILRVSLNFDYIKGRLGFGDGFFVPYFLFTDRKGQERICEEYVKEVRMKIPKL